jgi:hypothetical protein
MKSLKIPQASRQQGARFTAGKGNEAALTPEEQLAAFSHGILPLWMPRAAR